MQEEQGFSFKSLFVPFTTFKAIQWIIGIGLAVYFNSLFNGFVWDDFLFIVNNPGIHSFNLLHFFSKNLFNTGSYYRPLSATYFAIIYNAFNGNSFFFHLSQVILHIVDTSLAFLLFTKFYKKSLSFFLALIFLVHPINVESVAYIASSQGVLFFFFGIVALLLSFHKATKRNLFLIALFSLLSLLTKEVGILFVLLVILSKTLYEKSGLMRTILTETVVFTMYLCIRIFIGHVFLEKFLGPYPVPMEYASLPQRLINMPAITLHYLVTIIYPDKLAVVQNWIITKPTLQNFTLPLIIDAFFFFGLILLGVYVYQKSRKYFPPFIFFSMWFITGFFMILQFFPLEFTVTDYWFYFPFIGILGLIGTLEEVIIDPTLCKNLSTKPIAGKIFLLAGILLVCVFGIRTIIRNSNFYSQTTLYSHDLKVRDNFILENDLGVMLYQTGNIQEALYHFQKSVKEDPYPINLFSLGYWYQLQGNEQKAQYWYYQALVSSKKYFLLTHRHDMNDEKIRYKLAESLLLTKQYAAAKKVAGEGLKYLPKSVILWEELAISESLLGHHKEALRAVGKAQVLATNQITQSLYEQIANGQSTQEDTITMVADQLGR